MSQEMTAAKTAESKGVKYAFKDGATALIHPFWKEPLTVEHLNGPNGKMFIKAIKHLDKQAVEAKKQSAGDGWYDRHIQEVK